MMIDLLFGALMFFAFQMGNPNATNIAAIDIELPSTETATGGELELLGILPREMNGGRWLYVLPDGATVSAENVAALARAQGRTVILILARETAVQTYLDAEKPLRTLGLDVGLAVEEEG